MKDKLKDLSLKYTKKSSESRMEVWAWGMCQEPRDQVGSSKEAKNRNMRVEKLLELIFFKSVGKTGTLRLQIIYSLSQDLHDGRIW